MHCKKLLKWVFKDFSLTGFERNHKGQADLPINFQFWGREFCLQRTLNGTYPNIINSWTKLRNMNQFQEKTSTKVLYTYPVGPGFVNQDRDWEISIFGPANEIGTRNSIS